MNTTSSNLRSISRDLERLNLELWSTVAQARAEGQTWEQIGESLGISRQAACKRFS